MSWTRTVLLVAAVIVGAVLVGGGAYLQHPKFGAFPDGDRQAAVERSPHYADGDFHNLVPTPRFTEDRSFVSVLVENLLTTSERPRPVGPLPAVKADLKALAADLDTVVWLGHSSFYVQLAGKRILIDPVFSENAAPVPFANRAFAGTTPYSADDMPAIDYLLITHDHWDHLDYDSVKALQPKAGRVVTGLGMGAYFEGWGYGRDRLSEADWFSTLTLAEGLAVHVLPARHYSGRLLTRNKMLWVAFALETPTRRLFFSGDSGYGPHFAEIGQRFGAFDLAVLDSGQYDKRWALVHMFPEEAAQAAEDLRARALVPAHLGRFSISKHSWDDPLKRIATASDGRPYRLLTPVIGQPMVLDQPDQHVSRWWEGRE